MLVTVLVTLCITGLRWAGVMIPFSGLGVLIIGVAGVWWHGFRGMTKGVRAAFPASDPDRVDTPTATTVMPLFQEAQETALLLALIATMAMGLIVTQLSVWLL